MQHSYLRRCWSGGEPFATLCVRFSQLRIWSPERNAGTCVNRSTVETVTTKLILVIILFKINRMFRHKDSSGGCYSNSFDFYSNRMICFASHHHFDFNLYLKHHIYWDLLRLLENTFDRKHISAHPSPNPKVQWRNVVIFEKIYRYLYIWIRIPPDEP